MNNVIQFPDRFKKDEDSEIGLMPLLGIPHMEVFTRVISQNSDMFRYCDCMEAGASVELFTDSSYPNTILADIDNLTNDEEIRGLYRVELTSYQLTKISDEPLIHFKE